MADTNAGAEAKPSASSAQTEQNDASVQEPKTKRSRTNTPWTPAEELRLKQMRDAGNSWSEIAKVDRHQRYCPSMLTEHYRRSHNGQKAASRSIGTRYYIL